MSPLCAGLESPSGTGPLMPGLCSEDQIHTPGPDVPEDIEVGGVACEDGGVALKRRVACEDGE